MNETGNNKKVYDLEERTFIFAKDAAIFCRSLPKTLSDIEYARQLIRSSASVGANYIEANEALSKKDFVMRVRISRKECKESLYWLRLISETNEKGSLQNVDDLLNEAVELKKILSKIIDKSV